MDDEPLYRRVVCLEPERSVGGPCVCVCVRQAETGGQRRRFGTFGEQPGGGAQRGTGMRQHPSADSRAAACGPTGEGRTGRTHTAPAVTHSLPAACVCVCV